jgi:hypothetical protein
MFSIRRGPGLFLAGHHRNVHPAVLGPPLVKRGRTDAGLTAQRGHRLTSLGSPNGTNNLAGSGLGLLHVNLFGKHRETIPLLTSADFHGNHSAK